ncbi:hypothetical protein AB6E53_19335 [Vibrio breoganii]|uniref:hypothetical protein n=1 Tax=Vibrio breoganii TaxID=553239 RepID=UPI0011131A7B|nr:hypothetical protein [Vibrio breoganii]
MTFNIYREIPSVVLIFGYFLSAATFFYLIANDITSSRLISSIFSLLCINAPPYYSLLLWPVSPFSSYFMLLSLYFFSKRNSSFETLLLSGVLSFGIISNLHFLSPLIFINKLVKETYRRNFIFFLNWILTFVIGYIVANVLVYIVTLIKSDEATFIDIGLQTWRLLRPDGELDILYNIEYAIETIWSDIVYGKIYILFFGILINYKLILKSKSCSIIVMWSLLIYMSFYSSNLIHGIRIDFRSIISAFIGLSMLHIVSFSKVNMSYLLLCVAFFSYGNKYKVEWYSKQTDKVKSRFSEYQEDISKGGELSIIYWNSSYHEDLQFDVSDKPYGLIDLNNFPLKQVTPYFIEQGFNRVELVEYDIPYTGRVRYERNGDTIYVYME